MTELGTMVVYNLKSDLKVGLDDLREEAISNDVPLFLLPNCIGNPSAFRRATSDVATSILSNTEPIICREVSNSNNVITRAFEILHKDEKNLSAVKTVATMAFNKRTTKITYSILTEEGRNIVEEVLRNYGELSGNITAKEIRKSIQRALAYYHGVKTDGGGKSYFVPKDTWGEWENFSYAYKMFEGIDFTEVDTSDSARSQNTITHAVYDHIRDYMGSEIEKLGGQLDKDGSFAGLFKDFEYCLHKTELGADGIRNMIARMDEQYKGVEIYNSILSADLGSIIEKLDGCMGCLYAALDMRVFSEDEL